MFRSVGVLPYFYAMSYLLMYLYCNKMPTRASGMCLGESVTVCFGSPVPPADLSTPSLSYEVRPDLATVPPAPSDMWFALMRPAMSVRMFVTTLPAP